MTRRSAAGPANRRPEGAAPTATEGRLPPELELLLACARVDGADDEMRIGRLLEEGPDWDRALRYGGRHGILPLLYRRLSVFSNPSAIPEPVMAALRRRYYAMAERNLLLTGRLAELTEALERRDVASLPLKGPVLAVTVYENLALREIGDLDVLVRGEDLEAARQAFAAEGLAPLEHLSPGQEVAFRTSWYASTWRDGRTGVLVELHWRLVPRFFFPAPPLEELWASAETLRLHGREIRTLGPEELLLGLCVHGAKDEPDPWSRLKWIRDVAAVARAREDLDWDRLGATAGERGCRRMLHLGLHLAWRLFGAPVPRPVRDRVERDGGAVELAARVERTLFGEPEPTTRMDRLRFEMRVRERVADRARTLLGRALLPDFKDIGLARLPAWLAFLYFPLRGLRLAWGGLARPWRLRGMWRPLERDPKELWADPDPAGPGGPSA